MQGFRLTSEQIQLGANALSSWKLKQGQVDDLVSVFRGYLCELADDYELEATFSAETDTAGRNRAAKLSACLILLQDNEFINGGFAPTNANRTGLNYSIDRTNYDIFRYMMGLFWTIPSALDNRWLNGNAVSNIPTYGRVIKEW